MTAAITTIIIGKNHDKLGGKKQENYVNLEKHGGRKRKTHSSQPEARKGKNEKM